MVCRFNVVSLAIIAIIVQKMSVIDIFSKGYPNTLKIENEINST